MIQSAHPRADFLSFLKLPARKKSLILGSSIASLLGLGLLAPQAQAESTGIFSTSGSLGLGDNDANVGLSNTKTYVNAVDLGAAGTLTINGVIFEGVPGGNPSGTGWSLQGADVIYPSGGTNPQGQLGALTNSFIYNGRPATLTLSDLKVGETYVISFYNRAWDAPGQRREQEFTASGASSGTAVLDQDIGDAGQGHLNIMRYTFLATGTTQTLSIMPLNTVNTMHLYGFSTEQTFNNTWTSGTTWSSAAWSKSTPDGIGSNAAFGAQASAHTITLDSDRTVGHLQFDGTSAWTLNGSSALTLQTDVGGVSVLSTLAGSHVITAPIALFSDAVKQGEGTLTLSGEVSGPEGLSVNGGTLILSAVNSYSGGTTVDNGGTLRLGVAGALGAEEASLTVKTGGLLDLNGTSQSVGILTGTGGTIANNAIGTQVKLTIGTGSTGSGNFRGVIADNTEGTGTVSLTKVGFDTITLSGANTYSGATVIRDGKLQLNGAAATDLKTSGIEISGTGVLGFTSGAGSTLTLKTGSTLTLAGGGISFDLGAPNASDKIVADAVALTANSTFTFVPLGPLSYGTPYTLATYNSASNPGNFTIAGFTAGRLSIQPVLGANAITATPTLDSTTWNSAAGGAWSATGSWNNYVPKDVGDSAVFGPALLSNDRVEVDGAQTVGYITFNNSAASYEIGTPGSSNLRIENTGAIPGFIAVDAGSHTILENVALASDLAISSKAGTTLALKGILSGTKSLTTYGDGKVVITGASTYSGGTTITGGTLQLGDGVTNGSIVGNIANNGALVFHNSTSQEVTTVISGTGQVTKQGTGKLTLKGANTFTGGLTISEGTVDIGGESATGAVIGTITNNGTLRFSRTGVITIDAVVNGTGTTVLAGGVSQNLSATAAINTPHITVGDSSQGYVYFGAPNQMNGTTGAVLHIGAHTANSRINLNGFNQTIAGLTGAGIVQNHETDPGTSAATLTINVPGTNSYSWTGLIRNMSGGALGLTKTGTGEQIMNFGIAPDSYAGATKIEQGRLVFGSTLAAPAWGTSGIAVSAGAELGLTGAGTSVISWETSSRVISGAGSVVRVGADTNVVTITNGTNSYTGATKLSGTGTLSITTLANIGFNSSIGAGTGTDDATNAASLVFDGGILRYTGGAVSSNRLFTLTEKGGTFNAGGTGAVRLTNPGTLATSGSGARTLVLTGTSTANNTLAGILADGAGGATSLTKSSSGTWVLTGANTYTGTTTVSGGRLQLEGGAATSSASSNVAVNAGGTLAFSAGVGSTLTLANTLTLSGGTIAFDLGSAAASDKIAAGTLTLTANSAFSFNPIAHYDYGSTYTLATYSTLNNTGPFTIAGLTAGRLSLTPNIGANAITMTPTLDNAVWDNTTGGTWAAGPWTGYTPNAVGDAALFGSKLAANGTVTVGAATTAGYLTFANTAASYTLGTAGSANLTLASTGTAPAQVAVEAGNHTIAEDVTLASDLFIFTEASTSLTVNGGLHGATKSVTKAGAGTLTLNGANAFGTTGTFSINGGSVVVGSETGLPTGVGLRVNSGSLDLNGHDANLSSLGGTGGTISDSSTAAGKTLIHINQAGTTTYSGTILDGAARSVALFKDGVGSLTLTGANTYSGGLTIMNGSIVAANPAGASLRGEIVFGDGTPGLNADKLFLIMGAKDQFAPGTVLHFASGERDSKLELRGFDQTVAGLDSTSADRFSIIQNQEAVDSAGSATLTINATEDHDFFGLIRALGSTEGNSLNLLKTGPGTQIIRNSGVAQTYFGTATVNEGKLTFNYETRPGSGGGHETLGGTSNFVVNAGGTLGLDGQWNMNKPVSGAGNVIKEGLGEVTISSELTHTGHTTVAEGTLKITGSISGSSVIEVKADATLEVFSALDGFKVGATQLLTGTGTVEGDVAVNGTIAPGPGIGTLSMGTLVFNGGSTLALEINTSTLTSDLLLTTSGLTLDTNVSPTLSLADLGGNVSLALGTQFTLLTYQGTWNGGLFNVGGTPIADGGIFTLGANQFQLDYNAGANGNNLTLVAVPEPGSAALLLGGLAGLLGFRRRRA